MELFGRLRGPGWGCTGHKGTPAPAWQEGRLASTLAGASAGVVCVGGRGEGRQGKWGMWRGERAAHHRHMGGKVTW